MELNIDDLLGTEKGNLYLVTSRERDIDILRNTITEKNHKIVTRILRGQRCLIKESLYQEFAAALQFPYYAVSQHWDGFDECITDLSWLPASRYIFFITNFDQVLADNPDDLHIFIEVILKDAINQWDKDNEFRKAVPFQIIFHCEPDKKEKSIEILKKEDIIPNLRTLKPLDDIK